MQFQIPRKFQQISAGTQELKRYDTNGVVAAASSGQEGNRTMEGNLSTHFGLCAWRRNDEVAACDPNKQPNLWAQIPDALAIVQRRSRAQQRTTIIPSTTNLVLLFQQLVA